VLLEPNVAIYNRLGFHVAGTVDVDVDGDQLTVRTFWGGGGDDMY
jgi:hypothetical protein